MVDKTECTICKEKYSNEELVMVNTCNHSFCKECLTNYLELEIKEHKTTIKCPEQCEKIIEVKLIEELVEVSVFEKYMDVFFKKYIEDRPDEYRFCSNPNCLVPFEIKSICNDYFECGICQTKTCLNCSSKYHLDKTCKNAVSQNDKDFRKFVKNNGYTPCSKCKSIVEKKEACDHMTCSKCNHEFCYVCGATWEVMHICVVNDRLDLIREVLGENSDSETEAETETNIVSKKDKENNINERENTNTNYNLRYFMPIIAQSMINEVDHPQNIYSTISTQFYSMRDKIITGKVSDSPFFSYSDTKKQISKKTNSISSYSKNTVLKSDGTPDMRYASNKNSIKSTQKSEGPLKSDGTPDMRYASNKNSIISISKSEGPLKSDGTPDMRFASNKVSQVNTSFSNSSFSGHLKSDGTPDMRFAENKNTYSNNDCYSYSKPSTSTSSSYYCSGPKKSDGTPDMRYSSNKNSYSSSSYSSSYSSSSSYSGGYSSGPLKSNGTPDMRYSANKRYK
jgi:hypothetical protein